MKLDRMIGILSILLQEDRVTAPELAERFEVSRRTVNRDIEALCRAGIPIVTTRGQGGGIAIADGYRVDRTLLTRADMYAILAGLRSLDSVSDTNRYAQLMEKMSAGASTVLAGGDRILIDLSSWYGRYLAEKVERIHVAIDESRVVRFRYFSPKEETERAVEPAYLVFRWSSWYVWGWCRARNDARLFKLNRMTELRLGEPFVPRELPPPDLSAERVFPGNYAVRALIEPRYRWRLIEEYGPECFAEQPDGRLLFSHGFTDRDQVITWILSFQDGAELLEPAEMRGTLADIGTGLAKRYAEEKGEGRHGL